MAILDTSFEGYAECMTQLCVFAFPDENGACHQYPCQLGASCVVRSNGFPTCECPSCSEEFEPVCGSDGISYTNECKLRKEACEHKKDIYVDYKGLCGE